ncbi:MAG: hypothetical protein ACYCYP_12735 [Leptospirales bacterium]
MGIRFVLTGDPSSRRVSRQLGTPSDSNTVRARPLRLARIWGEPQRKPGTEFPKDKRLFFTGANASLGGILRQLSGGDQEWKECRTLKMPERKSVVVGLLLCSIAIAVIGGSRPNAGAEEDLTQKVKDAGQAAEKSIRDAAHKTGAYLKSDKFHKDLKRGVDGTADAIKKGGNWVGHKLDSLSKPDPAKK